MIQQILDRLASRQIPEIVFTAEITAEESAKVQEAIAWMEIVGRKNTPLLRAYSMELESAEN